MELIDLIYEMKDLRTHSRSYHVDDQGEYGELVIFSEDLPQWASAIAHHLGEPVKTPEDPVTPSLTALTEPFGELFDHQTLYLKETPGLRILAMIWPWRDNLHTTVKLIFQRETEAQD